MHDKKFEIDCKYRNLCWWCFICVLKCLASTSDGKDTAVDRAYSGDEAGEVEYTTKFWQKQFWLFKKKNLNHYGLLLNRKK